MKQGSERFEKALKFGLRRFRTNPRGTPSLVECFNMAPCEQGLEPHEEITSLGESGVAWGGTGEYVPSEVTRTITIRVTDYVDNSELQTVSVSLDGVVQGTTDANGEIDISDVEVGGHELKLTKTGYVDSDEDDLFNDYIFVI